MKWFVRLARVCHDGYRIPSTVVLLVPIGVRWYLSIVGLYVVLRI